MGRAQTAKTNQATAQTAKKKNTPRPFRACCCFAVWAGGRVYFFAAWAGGVIVLFAVLAVAVFFLAVWAGGF